MAVEKRKTSALSLQTPRTSQGVPNSEHPREDSSVRWPKLNPLSPLAKAARRIERSSPMDRTSHPTDSRGRSNGPVAGVRLEVYFEGMQASAAKLLTLLGLVEVYVHVHFEESIGGCKAQESEGIGPAGPAGAARVPRPMCFAWAPRAPSGSKKRWAPPPASRQNRSDGLSRPKWRNGWKPSF